MSERTPTRNGCRTALFLCECGPNVAESLDVGALADWARGESLELVEVHELLCSPAGREAFLAKLGDSRADRVVVAACTPKMHEKTFQELSVKAGLNLGHVQVANIREQCAWITGDRVAATEKAKSLIRSAVRRVGRSESLEERFMEALTDVVVIGGGIAGIEAALTASRAGRKVTIVERDISLGGSVVRTEEVAPSLECAPCLLAPRLTAVRDDPNITVVANAEVTAVLGFYGNFTVRIRRSPRCVDESCIGCEACFDVCPVEIDSPFHLGLGAWKAIHTLFPGSVPAAAAIDAEHCLGIVDGSCRACVEACPFSSIDLDQREEAMEVQAGAVVVATGLEEGDVSAIPELGHGTVEEVYTLDEFERLVCTNGPTGGRVARRDGTPPASVAVVHCAGSRREDGLSWCSGTCCSDGVKVGRLIARQHPDAEVIHIHRDLVFPGPDAARFFAAARDAGSVFVPCEDLRSVSVLPSGGRIRVRGGGFEPRVVDMVVLATGRRPARGTPVLASMLGVELTPEGFFRSGHDILAQTASTLDGIYVAGEAAGPCDIPQAVTRARAAAGDAISRLVPGRRIELEAMTSVIDPEACAGCKLCLPACPYRAISFDPEEGVCRVNEAICRGCGTCTAGCPSGASRARHYSDEEIYAEMGGVIHA